MLVHLYYYRPMAEYDVGELLAKIHEARTRGRESGDEAVLLAVIGTP